MRKRALALCLSKCQRRPRATRGESEPFQWNDLILSLSKDDRAQGPNAFSTACEARARALLSNGANLDMVTGLGRTE